MHVNDANLPRNRGYWKLNTSFLEEEPYITGILENKDKWLEDLGDSENDIIKWEYIKLKIRQFSIQYGKQKAKTMSREEKDLETKLHDLEEQSDGNAVPQNNELEEINHVRRRLEEISNYNTEGLILRSQSNWSEQGEKSNSYFCKS